MADSQTATSAPEFKSAHFIGIGGAGMSGIASFCTSAVMPLPAPTLRRHVISASLPALV